MMVVAWKAVQVWAVVCLKRHSLGLQKACSLRMALGIGGLGAVSRRSTSCMLALLFLPPSSVHYMAAAMPNLHPSELLEALIDGRLGGGRHAGWGLTSALLHAFPF
jgi:hypothetical protein